MTLAQKESKVIEPDADTVYQVVSNQRRRYAICILADLDKPIDIGTLAERIAALENGQSIENINRTQRKNVRVALHQHHLPMMKEARIIRSEQEWAQIELTARGSEVEKQLLVRGENKNLYYLCLLLLGSFLLGLAGGFGFIYILIQIIL